MNRFFILLLSMTWMAGSAMAQDKMTLQEGYKVHTTEIKGRLDPSRVPFSAKMGFFCGAFDFAYQHQLAGLLEESDISTIKEFIIQDAKSLKGDTHRYQAQTKKLCEQIDTMSAAALSIELLRRDEEFNSKQEQRYRRLLRSLSPEGRALVESFLDNHIAPKVSLTKVDGVAMWNEFPEEMKEQFRAACNASPEEIGQLVEALNRQESNAVTPEASTNASVESATDPIGNLPE